MASLANVDAPGAYPATPSNEEPRGRNNTEQSTHPSLAQSVGATTPSNQYPTQQTPFSKETPRSSRISAQPSGTKPGVMETDAYSRVGTQDGAFAQGSNYTYDNVSASLSPYDANSQRYSDTGNTLLDLDTPTNIVPPANTPAETTALNSISNTAANSHGDHSNKARSGLRGSSASEHNEPYWGNIPFGTGVYNGVTGHGSDEPTTQHNSLRDQHSARTNPRIYNGVTGHGSENSASPQIFKHDQDMTTDDYSHQQRAFPLTGNADTATTTRLEDAHEHKRDSRFKEGLAGAGVTAAGDYAAHKYPNRDSDKEAKTMDETLNGLRRGEPDTLSYPCGQKGDETFNKHEGAGRALPHRTFAAVPTQDYTKRDRSERKPVETRKGKRGVEDSSSAAVPAHNYAEGQELEKQPLEEDRRKEYPNPGYYGAAAAGAGAGAYGMHKYANRANAKERSSTGRQQPHYDMLQDGAPLDNLSSSQYEPCGDSNSGTSHNVTGDTQNTGRDSSDSSHGGQYNVLSSGTPSGINLEHANAEKHHHHREQPSTIIENPSSSASQTAAGMYNPAAVGSSRYGDNDRANEGQTLRELETQGLANEISAGGAFSSGRKVTHRCTKCGEENDISEHFRM